MQIWTKLHKRVNCGFLHFRINYFQRSLFGFVLLSFFFFPKENECKVWYIPWDSPNYFVQGNANLVSMDQCSEYCSPKRSLWPWWHTLESSTLTRWLLLLHHNDYLPAEQKHIAISSSPIWIKFARADEFTPSLDWLY